MPTSSELMESQQNNTKFYFRSNLDVAQFARGIILRSRPDWPSTMIIDQGKFEGCSAHTVITVWSDDTEILSYCESWQTMSNKVRAGLYQKRDLARERERQRTE